MSHYGIRKMLAACLFQAVKDAKKKRNSQDKAEALRWIESHKTDAFTFCWMCETIGVDSRKIRNAAMDLDLKLKPVRRQKR